MRKFTEAVFQFVKAEDGPTAVEYAVILALILVVCVAAITLVGTGSSDVFDVTGSAAGVPSN